MNKDISPQEQWQRWFLISVLAFMCLAIAITNTYYVGDATIYREDKQAENRAFHNNLLYNQLPEGGWEAHGANGTNCRIFAIYLAETVHRYSGVDILRIYRSMDLIFIALTLFLSFFFFRSLVTTSTAIIGILYLGWILPLTYAFHVFHPWDRIGWFAWLLAIFAIRKDKPYLLAIIVVLGVTIKMDLLAVAGLYFLVYLNRTNWKRVTLTTAVISLMGIATLAFLSHCLPGGVDTDRVFTLIGWMKNNYWVLCKHPIDHPAFLAFPTIFCVALMGLRSRNRFAIASFSYGLFLLSYIAKSNNFIEIRAQMGFVLLLLPLALIGLDRIFQAEHGLQEGAQP
ncbi:MAG: hypothetical protein P8N76_21040 [Pirellulaceae bacterium]|nr:hypothetical protein [Pirellulaceae bacterium]